MPRDRIALGDNVWIEERGEHPNGTICLLILDDEHDPEEVRIHFSNGDYETYPADMFDYWSEQGGGMWQCFHNGGT